MSKQNLDEATVLVDAQVEFRGLEYNEELVSELEDIIAKAVNEFRELYPNVTVLLNGVG